MVVDKIGSWDSYGKGNYQKSVDYGYEKTDGLSDIDEMEQEIPQTEAEDFTKPSEAMDKIPVTVEQLRDKTEEPSTKDKIHEVIEDQKFVHDKIRKSLDEYSCRMGNYEAKFGMHEATNRVMIKLVDKDTKEVVKELPPEKTLDMIAKCLEQAGILVDEKV